MKIILSKAWQLGFLILILNIFMNEVIYMFNDYVFSRLGINRSYLALILWVLPFISAFIATYYSKNYKLLYGVSYIFIFPIMATFAHYIHGEFGGAIDFRGIKGAMEFFKVHSIISFIIIIIGTVAGFTLSSEKSDK
jgi:hypothetical protein